MRPALQPAAAVLDDVPAIHLARLGLVLMAAVAFAEDAEPLHRFFLAVTATPSLLASGEVQNTIDLSPSTFAGLFLLLVAALPSVGRWGLRVALVVGVLLIVLPTLVKSIEAPFNAVDSISYTRYGTRLLMSGQHPYRDFDAFKADEMYPIQPTAVTYNLEGTRVSSLNYPAGAFLSLVPLSLLGDLDPRWLYGASVLVLTGLLVLRAPPSLRLLVLAVVVFHQFYYLWTIAGGIAEPLWMTMLVLAWMVRERTILGGGILGWALSTKQLAWFFLPFYLIAVWHQQGLRPAIKAGAVALLVFAATNLPFALTEPRAWWEGVMAPMLASFPPQGVALAHWGAITFPAVPKSVYTALEAAAMLAGLGSFLRWGRRAPALVFVLPWVPLWFAWRCLSVYFYLMPLATLYVLLEQHSSQPSFFYGLRTLLSRVLSVKRHVTIPPSTGSRHGESPLETGQRLAPFLSGEGIARPLEAGEPPSSLPLFGQSSPSQSPPLSLVGDNQRPTGNIPSAAAVKHTDANLLLPIALLLVSIVALALTGAYEAYLVWDELVNLGLPMAFRQRLAFLTLILSAFSLALMVASACAYGEGKRLRLFSVFASTLMLVFVVFASLASFPTYRVDNAMATHYAAERLLDGENPYQTWDMSAAAARFHVPEGLLAGTLFSDALAYPAGSFLILAPFVAAGLADVRLLSGLAELALVLVAFGLAAERLKPIALAIALCAVTVGFLFIGEGYNEVLVVMLLLGAWLWRNRPVLSGVVLGVALATKQTAWFFLPFYLIAIWRAGGRAALGRCALAAGIFVAANAPFFLASPDSWVRGVLSFAAAPWLAGAPPPLGYIGAAAGVLALVAYRRWGDRWPQAALVLPWVPLWFLWPSLFSIFHLLPLMVLAASQQRQTQETSASPESIPHTSPAPV